MARKPKKRKFASEKDLANIDRFAGSSEEDNDDDEVSDNEESDHDDERKKPSAYTNDESDMNDSDAADDDDAVKDDEGDADNDVEDDPVVIQTGMASVMQRLLSSRTVAGAPTAVLSKTKTKLQIQSSQEQDAAKDLKDRKKANREKKLVALHIPLTGDNITAEVERERTHKRIATKGVVALFNAITKHQQPQETPTQQLSKTSKTKDSKLTKDKFLDMIKKKATSDGVSPAANSPTAASSQTKATKWEALRDDFKIENSKNWDEESSEDDGEAMDDT